MVKIAIIGCGNIARFHVHAFKETGFSIVAISGRENSYNKLKKFSEINDLPDSKIFSNSLDLIHSNIWDALLICCPTKNTLEYLKIASNYKKPILAEKPIDYQSKNLLPLIKYENIKVAFNRRFYDSVKFAKNFYDVNNVSLIKVSIPEKNNNNSESKKFPDSIYDNSIHMFDLLNYILGSYNFTFCKSFIHESEFKTIISTGKSKNGSLVQLDICFNSSDNFSINIISNEKRVELCPIEIAKFYDGIEISEPTGEIPIRRYNPIIRNEIISATLDNIKTGFYMQAKDFYGFCKNKPSENATIKDAYNSLKSIDQLYELQKK